MPPDIHRAIVELAERGESFAVAVVLRADGHAPCRAGAKALIDRRGAIRGTIGGGMVEAEAQRRAIEAMQTGRPAVFDFDLEGRAVAASQPICGGRMRVLIDPTAAQHRAAYAAAATARERRQRGVLVTFVETPSAGIPTVENTPETAAIRVTVEFHAVVPVAPTDPLLEVFVEPILPAPLVVVVGGGHVGQAVAVQADLVGFDILVIDDRAEFTGHELFPPGTTTRCGPIAAEVAALPLAADTYVVIVTRGHEQDAEALAACIHKPAAYLGMIGSRRKVAMMREAFIASGQATAAEFDRVHAPIGLGIGAWTVPEIAVSIVAELIAERRSQGPYWERNTSCGVRWKLVQ